METELMKISHIKYLEKKLATLKEKVRFLESSTGHYKTKVPEMVNFFYFTQKYFNLIVQKF